MAKVQSYRPWVPVAVHVGPEVGPGLLNKADVVALRALQDGDATAEQQKRALDAIVRRIACAHELSFRPDDHGGVRDTDFSEGKRFVGLQILKMLNVPLDKLTGEQRS